MSLAQRLSDLISAIGADVKVALNVTPPYTAPSGCIVRPSHLVSGVTSGVVSGNAYWTPLDVGPGGLSIAAIIGEVTVARVGGAGTMTIGLYKDNGTGGAPLLTPAGLLVSGAIDTLSTGRKEVAYVTTLPPGRYWGGTLYVQTTAPTTAPSFMCVSTCVSLWITNGVTLAGTIRAVRATGQTVLPTSTQTLSANGSSDSPFVSLRVA